MWENTFVDRTTKHAPENPMYKRLAVPCAAVKVLTSVYKKNLQQKVRERYPENQLSKVQFKWRIPFGLTIDLGTRREFLSSACGSDTLKSICLIHHVQAASEHQGPVSPRRSPMRLPAPQRSDCFPAPVSRLVVAQKVAYPFASTTTYSLLSNTRVQYSPEGCLSLCQHHHVQTVSQQQGPVSPRRSPIPLPALPRSDCFPATGSSVTQKVAYPSASTTTFRLFPSTGVLCRPEGRLSLCQHHHVQTVSQHWGLVSPRRSPIPLPAPPRSDCFPALGSCVAQKVAYPSASTTTFRLFPSTGVLCRPEGRLSLCQHHHVQTVSQHWGLVSPRRSPIPLPAPPRSDCFPALGSCVAQKVAYPSASTTTFRLFPSTGVLCRPEGRLSLCQHHHVQTVSQHWGLVSPRRSPIPLPAPPRSDCFPALGSCVAQKVAYPSASTTTFRLFPSTGVLCRPEGRLSLCQHHHVQTVSQHWGLVSPRRSPIPLPAPPRSDCFPALGSCVAQKDRQKGTAALSSYLVSFALLPGRPSLAALPLAPGFEQICLSFHGTPFIGSC